MEHSEFAIQVILETSVHFALRRTKPTLYRHDYKCMSFIRVFGAIDDGRRIACSGIKWGLVDNSVVTVLLVACLGYTKVPENKKKSVKVDDMRATHVIVRDTRYQGQPLHFQQMARMTAMKLFEVGTPVALVDLLEQQMTNDMVQQFIDRLERNDEGENWLKIPTFFKPLLPEQPTPCQPVHVTENKAKAEEMRELRKRKREADKKVKQARRLQAKLLREKKEKERKVKQAIEARRRRNMIKTIDSRVNDMKDTLLSALDERFDFMRENLEENLQVFISEKVNAMAPPPPPIKKKKMKKKKTSMDPPPAKKTLPRAMMVQPPPPIPPPSTAMIGTSDLTPSMNLHPVPQRTITPMLYRDENTPRSRSMHSYAPANRQMVRPVRRLPVPMMSRDFNASDDDYYALGGKRSTKRTLYPYPTVYI